MRDYKSQSRGNKALKPLVSVIIPAYNRESYLAASLESVFAQEYRPLDVIVVDDGSNDETAAVARSFREVHYIHQDNQGSAAARNTGVKAAKGSLLAFLDADDLWKPDKLSKQVGYLNQHPGIGFALTRMQVRLEPGMEWPQALNRDYYLNDPPGYIPSTLLVRKTVFEQVGMFESSFRPSEDSEWFFRARDKGIKMALIPEALIIKQIHESNISHSTQAITETLFLAVRDSIKRKLSPELEKHDKKR